MKQEEQLISKYGKDSGMKVPEGYFSDLQKNIMDSLPPYPKAAPFAALSRWQKVKPYVYLAAMFCGIWLMMKVFHVATQPISLNLDNPPEALVDILDTDMDYEFSYSPYNTDEIEDEDFIMSYDNMEDFENDFGYSFKPEYSTITASNLNGKNG